MKSQSDIVDLDPNRSSASPYAFPGAGRADAQQFQGEDFTLDIPPTWEGRTVVTFAPLDRSRSDSSFVVSRQKLTPGDTPATFTTQQIAMMATTLPGFKVLEHASLDLHGVPAQRVVLAWGTPRMMLRQTLTVVPRAVDEVLLLVATYPAEDAAGGAAVMDRMAASFFLRQRSDTRPPVSAVTQKDAPGRDLLYASGNPPQGWGPGARRR